MRNLRHSEGQGVLCLCGRSGPFSPGRGRDPTKLSGSGLVLEQEQVEWQTAPTNSCRLRCACHGAFTHPDDFPGRPQRRQNLAFFGYCAPQGGNAAATSLKQFQDG